MGFCLGVDFRVFLRGYFQQFGVRGCSSQFEYKTQVFSEGIFRRCFLLDILVIGKGLWGLGKSLWFLYAGYLSTDGSKQTPGLIYAHSPQSAVKLSVAVSWEADGSGKGWRQLGSLRCSSLLGKATQGGLAVLMPSEVCGESVDLSFPKEWIHKKRVRRAHGQPSSTIDSVLKNSPIGIDQKPPQSTERRILS